MTLHPGTRLGPYEILAPIGAGGMGEVYRARDTRLGRDVAIKILAGESGDPARRRARFAREARAISALNHPHICILHDVGTEDGIDYLVMEECKGKTLAERLQNGPLALHEISDYTTQIADALHRAHRHGIIHRDLKPSNVMLTKSGVKMLDFGLARESSNSTPEESTMRQLSDEGALLGTLQYMAPEVLHGNDADARSDIYALGLLMYEMATGRRAFSGTSKAALIADIVEHEAPPVAQFRSDAPPSLIRLIDACLVKDPDERIQSAHDVMLQLQWSGDAKPPPKTQRKRWWLGAAAIAVVVTATVVAVLMPKAKEALAIRRLAITLPADAAITFHGIGYPFAVSPDGNQLVYVGPRGLYVRDLDKFTVKAIAGTEGSIAPFFSPDGKWVGFSSGRRLRKVALAGGQPMTICETSGSFGASWRSDNQIFFAQRNSPLMRVAASGGSPQAVTREKLQFFWPFLLPSGKDALVTVSDVSGNDDRYDLAVVTLADGNVRTIVRGAAYGQYTSTGDLLFLRSSTIFRVAFDPQSMKIVGEPQPILDDVALWRTMGLPFMAAVGKSIYYVPYDNALFDCELVWADRQGRITPAVEERQGYEVGVLSPDRKQIATAICSRGECDIWCYAIDRSTWRRLTSDGHSRYALWSPDGRTLVYASNREGSFNLFTIAADGNGAPKRLTGRPNLPVPSSWSPDGKLIAERELGVGTGYDIWLLPADGKSPAIPWLITTEHEGDAAFSPDGHWITYRSSDAVRGDESEVYVRAASGAGPAQQVSVGGGKGPWWRGDGREIFYMHDTAMMAADFRATPTVVVGKPHLLFDTNFQGYDVTSDGQRFLLTRTPKLAPRTQINVVEGLLE